ncbi:hypothetical protein EOT10_05610 [Streptomyces antnestii]|uniref:Uncharacterized protein n=1 Tax=Streptomyces antnestii TaxID=2494256 RepID=A0A3S3UIY0_9ACTN|nr:hypothetical protein [Streptomyces sp. San01]RVU27770.1 hypothetical protein EOT10_05610 [Streptomyces sp. San01]
MATGGWGPGYGPQNNGGQPPAGPGPGNPYGPPPAGPYGPQPGAGPYGPPQPIPPQVGPYPYGPTRPPRRRNPLRRVPFLNIISGIIHSAHHAADRLFVQDGGVRINDPVVERVQLFRSVLGLLATLAIAFFYGKGDEVWSGAAGSGVGNLIITPVLLIVTGPLVVLGFILYAPPHVRPALRSRLRAPLRTVAWYVLSVSVFVGAMVATAKSAYLFTLPHWAAGTLALILLAMIVWGIPFLFFASLYSAKTSFNTAHVHPMLPGVLTAVLVWAVAVVNVFVDGMPEGPVAVRLCSLLGGPLSVTAVALWELRRMRTRHGVFLRG